MNVSYTFQKVSTWGHKEGRCCECGGRVKLKREFWQTLNPYNKNADGTERTSADIVAALEPQKKAWEATPPLHYKCERAHRARQGTQS